MTSQSDQITESPDEVGVTSENDLRLNGWTEEQIEIRRYEIRVAEITGFMEGRRFGMIAARSGIFLGFVRARFGDIPKKYRKRVDDASLEDLDKWLSALPEAKSISAVFED